MLPAVKPTTTRRPPSLSERSESVMRSPPTGSMTTSARPAARTSSFHGPSERKTSSAPARRATSSFSSPATTAHAPAPTPLPAAGAPRAPPPSQPLGPLQRRRPDAARGAVDEHRLALLQAAAYNERE